MTRKTEAALKAVGIVLAMNVIVLVLALFARWLGLKPGIDFRATEAPGGIYVAQVAFIAFALMYYWDKVRRQ